MGRCVGTSKLGAGAFLSVENNSQEKTFKFGNFLDSFVETGRQVVAGFELNLVLKDKNTDNLCLYFPTKPPTIILLPFRGIIKLRVISHKTPFNESNFTVSPFLPFCNELHNYMLSAARLIVMKFVAIL